MGELTLVTLRDGTPRTLRAVLDNTPAAIFVKDPDGRYLMVNRAFERLHGKPRATSCSAGWTASACRPRWPTACASTTCG